MGRADAGCSGDAGCVQRSLRDRGTWSGSKREGSCVAAAETLSSSCFLSKDTLPQLLTGPYLTMRYRGRVVGAEEGDKSPEVENRPESVGGGRRPRPVMGIQAAVRLRQEIRALRRVLILDIVLHCFSGLPAFLFFEWTCYTFKLYCFLNEAPLIYVRALAP